MRNLELVESDPTAQLAEFKRGAALLQSMADQHRGLIINGPDDKDGFKRVHSARMTLKNARVSIESDRKKLSEYKRAVFAAKCDGMEIRWNMRPWPIDADGLTWIPMYVTENKLAVVYHIDRANRLAQRLSDLERKLKETLWLA